MRRLISIAVVSAFALPALGGLEHATLAIEATPARIDLAGSSGERRAVNFPSLEFPVRIAPNCPDRSTLASVSINVADARFRYTPDDFAGNASLETTIVVPAPQIAPVTIAHGCPAEDTDRNAGVIIADVLTAQVALRCAGDAGEQVLFDVVRLGVELRCPQPQETAALRDRQ